MWTWLAIAVLARVLMASREVDRYQSRSSLSDQLMDDTMEVELIQATLKPVTKCNHFYHDISPFSNSISGLIKELGLSGKRILVKSRKGMKEEREKRSPIKKSDPAPPGSWMSWITLENKALPIRTHQDPWQEIKKSRAFSPWGGERVAVFGQGQKVQRPIRVPFNSWGGKRSFSEDQKRTRFSSWGGKRGWHLGVKENSVENRLEKRTKFNAWGGKRSKNGERDEEEMKRTRFNAWGGKRSDKIGKRTPEEIVAKKSAFNAWGGKRFFTGYETNPLGYEKGLKYGRRLGEKSSDDRTGIENTNNVEQEEEEEEEKNKDEDEDKEKEDEEVREKKKEDNEIPLESDIIELPYKKGGGTGNYMQKSLFNPWGGRKRSENDADEMIPVLNSILPESTELRGHHHHGRFWPWGG